MLRHARAYGGLCVLALGIGTAGCRGFSVASTDGEGAPTITSTEQAACEPGPSPIRRMTRREFNNTVADLLGNTARLADGFPAEEEMLGFKNNADAQAMSPILAEKYLDAAEVLSKAAGARAQQLGGCGAANPGDEQCARKFIEQFGARAFRRPLASEDVEELLAFYRDQRGTTDFSGAIEAVTQVMLQSPEFLYRVEFGVPVEGQPHLRQLDSWEIASRLSYFLVGSMPDAALIEAAERDELRQPDQVAAHAARLLTDPRAKETVRDFHEQWLTLSRIDELNKDPLHFPAWNDEVKDLFRKEAHAFIDEVVWQGEGDLKSLLTAPYTYVNGPLATFYGLQGVSGSDFVKVALAPERSSGLLTQGGLLSVLAKPNQGSPIHRGVFVREKLLCEHIPPPPEGASLVPPDPDPNASTRDRFAQHRADPVCAGCHVLMDPVGFGFEHFDGVGRWRDEEAGAPIDASGEVSFTEIGKFNGVAELGQKLAGADQVQRCVSRQWFRFAQGRAELEGDRCNLDALQEAFSGSGYRIQDLMISLTQLSSFRYRTAPEGAQTP